MFNGGISQCYIPVFYTVPVTDAATASASSLQPSTTTQTDEKTTSHVVGKWQLSSVIKCCYNTLHSARIVLNGR